MITQILFECSGLSTTDCSNTGYRVIYCLRKTMPELACHMIHTFSKATHTLVCQDLLAIEGTAPVAFHWLTSWSEYAQEELLIYTCHRKGPKLCRCAVVASHTCIENSSILSPQA